MLFRLYNYLIVLAGHKYSLFVLALIAFVESSIFPIPPDVMLIPMIIAARNRAWLIAGVCTLFSVLGGLFGYLIGVFLFEEVGRPIIEFYNFSNQFSEFAARYNEWGAWAVLIAGITPFPYKVITILSGFSSIDIVVFVVFSIIARGARFFLVAALLWYYGEAIKSFIERHLGWLLATFILLLLGSFILVKFVI